MYPEIETNKELKNYIEIYNVEYPEYLEQKTRLDKKTENVKKLKEECQKDINNEIKKNLLQQETKKLNNDKEFQNLLSKTKYSHYKLAHIKDMINKYQNNL